MMKQYDKVEILLATYNGERYLNELLDSLVGQTYQNWELSISDDNSTDRTMEILQTFRSKYPEKVRSLSGGPGKGACANFLKLMEFSSCEIIAFCDQDDVWRSDKLEKMLNKYADVASKECHAGPIIVYSDALVVDEKLEIISESLLELNRASQPDRESFSRLQYSNCLTGCCLIANRFAVINALEAEKRLRLNYGYNIVMHDHWIGLVTANDLGLIAFVDEPLISYRQHAGNVIGAKKQIILQRLNPKTFGNLVKKHQMLLFFETTKCFPIYLVGHLIHSLFRR
jgi:glycosyltransferase involved in cell wall biosynthesis